MCSARNAALGGARAAYRTAVHSAGEQDGTTVRQGALRGLQDFTGDKLRLLRSCHGRRWDSWPALEMEGRCSCGSREARPLQLFGADEDGT